MALTPRLSDGLLLLAHSFGHETPPPSLPHFEHAGDAARDAGPLPDDVPFYPQDCDTLLYTLARSLLDARLRSELPAAWRDSRYTCAVRRACAGPAAKKCAGTCLLDEAGGAE